MARKVDLVVIHCSDSPDTKNIGFKEINEWHKVRGFRDQSGIHCGYHYIVRRDSKIELGRAENSMGAHVSGHNETSLGICWVGRTNCTIQQEHGMFSILKSILKRYGLSVESVLGHTELNPNKSCPNLDMVQFRKRLGEFLTLGEESWEKFLA